MNTEKFETGDIVLTVSKRLTHNTWTFEEWLKKKSPLGIGRVIRYEYSQIAIAMNADKTKKLVIVNTIDKPKSYSEGFYFFEDELVLIERKDEV